MCRLLIACFLMLMLIAGPAEAAAAWTGPSAGTVRVDLLTADRLIIGGDHHDLVALSAADGNLAWRYQADHAFALARLTVDGLLIGTSHPVRPDSTTLEATTQLFALDLASGEPRWSTTWPAEMTVVGATADILVIRGVASPLANPTGEPLEIPGVTGLDPRTGDVIWSGPPAYDARLEPDAPAALYLVSPGPRSFTYDLRALDPGTGAERWAAASGSPIALRIVQVDHERVYLATGQVETMLARVPGWLTAFDRAGGERLWEIRTGPLGLSGNGVLDADGLLIAAVVGPSRTESIVRALDPATGATVWTVDLAGFVHHAPVLGGGRVLIGLAGVGEAPAPAGVVIALDPTRGVLAWHRLTTTTWAGVTVDPSGRAMIVARGRESDEEVLTQVDAASGKTRWSLRVQHVGDIVAAGESLYLQTGRATQAVSDLRVYTGGTGLTALRQGTGVIAWLF